jgi:hypothetical protein
LTPPRVRLWPYVVLILGIAGYLVAAAIAMAA